jgi:hypothetical protein
MNTIAELQATLPKRLKDSLTKMSAAADLDGWL